MQPARIGLALAAVLGTARLHAAPPAAGDFDTLAACQAVREPLARVACYDEAVKALVVARDRKELVILDNKEVQATKRRVFGFSKLQLPFFGKGGQDVTQIETTLRSGTFEKDGTASFELEDGSRWRQQDDVVIGYRLRPGDKVVVRQRAFGAFSLSVAGRPGLRVRRTD